jgi:hypothetical protein
LRPGATRPGRAAPGPAVSFLRGDAGEAPTGGLADAASSVVEGCARAEAVAEGRPMAPGLGAAVAVETGAGVPASAGAETGPPEEVMGFTGRRGGRGAARGAEDPNGAAGGAGLCTGATERRASAFICSSVRPMTGGDGRDSTVLEGDGLATRGLAGVRIDARGEDWAIGGSAGKISRPYWSSGPLGSLSSDGISRKWDLTFSATSSSMALECDFLSVMPSSRR